MFTLKIKLLTKSFKSKHPNIIPDPKELSELLLSSLDKRNPSYKSVQLYLNKTIPCFYIPEHTVEDGNVKLDSSELVVFYKGSTTKSNIDLLAEGAKNLNSYRGVLASWKIHNKEEDLGFEANTFPWRDGENMTSLNGLQFGYLYKTEVPKPEILVPSPQRLTLVIDKEIELLNAQRFLNSLHRILVKSCPFNYQAIGSHMNDFISDYDSLYYNFHINDNGKVSEIYIESLGGITDEIVKLFDEPLRCLFFEDQQEFHVSFQNNEYFIPKQGTHFITVIPAFVTGKIKVGGQLKHTPAGSFLSSINHQLSTGNRNRVAMYEEDGWAIAEIPGIGITKTRCTLVESPLTGLRGGRRSMSDDAYQVEVITEKPVLLRNIGAQRRFGVGRLGLIS